MRIAFGVLAFPRPSVTVTSLVLLFGFYALVDGVFSLLTALGGGHHRLGSMAAGTGGHCGSVGRRCDSALSSTLSGGARLLHFILGHGNRIPANRGSYPPAESDFGEVWLALSGVLSVLFALMLMVRPAVGALALVWVIAGYALILGVFEIILGVELRGARTA
jgi:uncharacterized membrane protein HdeD (DUF308 family)